ncbi:response regulator transcription factor [Acidothermaceae bacterium B102]|nr:response regulator transcription factor [Acidothermaceae bacterium B102]
MTTPPAVLLVEDDRELADLLERLLTDEGYDVTVAPDGHRGLHLGLTKTFNALVLDRGLPAVEGLDLLLRLRGQGVTAPALILSARGTVSDRIAGLDAGAEDYLAKPFDVDELLARVRALLRRHTESATVLSLGTRVLDLDARLVRTADAPVGTGISLSEREAVFLALLARRPQRVFTRDELLANVFTDAESEVVVDTYVHYCRRKLGRGVIRTVRGVGFQLGKT